MCIHLLMCNPRREHVSVIPRLPLYQLMGVMKKKLDKIIFPWLLRALFFQAKNRYCCTNLVDRLSA